MQISKELRSILTLLWIPVVIGIAVIKPQQRFANQPSPQTAVIGSTVVLPCRIINMVGELQWTRDGFGLGNERQLHAFKRYTMIGSNEEGDYSLRVSPVTLEDDAEFQCQVTGWKDIPGVRSQTAKLTVYVHPERPNILQGPSVKTTAGESVKLECVSKGGKPAAEIQWLDSSGRVVTEGVHYTKQLLKDSHRFNAKSVLTLKADRKHHNTQFTCTATNPALHQPYKKQVRLEVTYPPLVSLAVDKGIGYKEGNTAILTCSALANPADLSFRWYRGGKLVSNLNETILRISKLNKASNIEDVTCEVSNRIGISRKTTRLTVRYGPVFSSEPKDVYAKNGDDVTLKCEVDGSPKPKIVWIPLDNSSFVFGKGESLTLRASTQTVGKYLCLAKVDDFPDISATVGLFLKVPPKVEAERIQWGQIGDTALLQCFVPAAISRSITVTWTYRGREIDLENGRYEIEKEISPEGLFFRLLVKGTKLEDFDAYSCSVHNNFGSDQVHILLKRKKRIPLTIVVASVAGGIIFILIVAIVAIVYGKKSSDKTQEVKKCTFPAEKSINITDQISTGNDSDLKVEIDNRTGSSMSTKDPEMEHSWEKGTDDNGIHNYLAGATTYLYPETYGNIPLKVNGHAGNTSSNLSYQDYQDRIINPTLSPVSQHAISGYPISSSFSARNQPPLHTSSQLNIYPYQDDYGGNIPQESVEGLRGLSSTLSNSLAQQIYKNGSSALHLSLSRPNGAPTTHNSIGTSTIPSATNSIPRLGIPVDQSHYIVPPRTQVLQGTLATHV